MKKIVSIFLISLLLFNSAGYVLIYLQFKSYLKKEAYNKLENFSKQNEITTIILSKNEFEKQKGNLSFDGVCEFEYFGEIYDISRIEYEGDDVRITALNDKDETNLNILFVKYFNKNINDKYSGAESILDTLIDDASITYKYDGVSSLEKDVCAFKFNFPVLNNFFDILTPPPKNLI